MKQKVITKVIKLSDNLKICELYNELYVNSMCWGSFFVPKFKHKGDGAMYPQDVYEEILMHKELRQVPQIYQTKCIHAVEDVLERKGYFSKSESEGSHDEFSNAYTTTY